MKKENFKKVNAKIKNFYGDFKKFISKGNIIDLAIAVIIGGAFSKIVSSLVNDFIMPLISLLTGGTNISDLKWVIKEAVYDINGVVVTAESAFRYGTFIQSIIDFLIIAFFIFVVFRIINASSKKLEKLKEEILVKIQQSNDTQTDKKPEVTEQAKKVLTDAQRQELLLTEIRDLLKTNIKANEEKPRGKNEWFSNNKSKRV